MNKLNCFSSKKNFTVMLPVKLSYEYLDCFIIDVMETGLGDWGSFNVDSSGYDSDLCSSEIASKILLSGRSIQIIEYDGGDDVEIPRELTLAKLLKGIEKYAASFSGNLSYDYENYDSQDCSAILQYALFDDVVYD